MAQVNSPRLRGQEVTLSVTINDAFQRLFGLEGRLSGTFTRVKEVTVSPRIIQIDESFIGEDFQDSDQRLLGYDLAFTVDELDVQAVQFMSLIAAKEANNMMPPGITIKLTYKYRDGSIPWTETYAGCVLRPAERSVQGRKTYVQNRFEAKAKTRNVSQLE